MLYNAGKKIFSTIDSASIIIVAALIIATACAYRPVQNYDFVNYDDNHYVYKNPHVTTGLSLENVRWAFTRSHASNWHPLTWLSHMVDYELFGLNAGGHHLISVIIHLINSFLIFVFFRGVTGAVWRSGLVALLFAIHPLHVQSVAWIAERKDVLSTLFLMLALLAYKEYATRPGAGAYARVLAYFLLGIMSKPMLVSFPFILLLLDYWPLQRIRFGGYLQKKDSGIYQRRMLSELIVEKIPLFLIVVASSLLTFAVQKSGGAVADFSFPARIANAVNSYLVYIRQMFWPQNLAVLYPHRGMPPLGNIVLSAGVIAGVSLVSIFALARAPWFGVGWFWYLGTLVPVIGIVQVGYQSHADRYTYIPLIGLFICLAWGIEKATEKIKGRKAVAGIVFPVLLAVLTMRSKAEVSYWENSITLFTRAIKAGHPTALAYNNIGSKYLEMEMPDSAEYFLGRALKISPEFAASYYNLGLIAAREGAIERAKGLFEKAVEYDPQYVDAYHALGEANEKMNQTERALEYYRKALNLNAGFWPAYNSLGYYWLQKKELDSAIYHFKKALDSKRDLWETHNALAYAYAENGKISTAVLHFKRAAEINPDAFAPYNNLGAIALKSKEYVLAEALFEEAIKRNAESVQAYINRARANVGLKKYGRAVSNLQAAAEITPDHPSICSLMAQIFKNEGKPDSAAIYEKKAR
ncbi:MAG: tetratricopeptide repeat protein, partial [Chitinivibrionales bacterium]|nr:tetratricopeptide repeat protein [Chitinivibrionales bacterium]